MFSQVPGDPHREPDRVAFHVPREPGVRGPLEDLQAGASCQTASVPFYCIDEGYIGDKKIVLR